MPSVSWKRGRYNQPWYTGETLSVGIGQSFWTVTPLQLTQALTTLVNRGERKVPHLLKATTEFAVTQEGSSQSNLEEIVYEEQAPLKLNQVKNWDLVLNAMHNTVQKVGATAYLPFKGSKYDAAGKTGSAQVVSIKQDEEYDAETTQENNRDNAMFIAFAPFRAPEIVIAVAIENVAKGGGGTNAGPVARQIMDQYFGSRVITSSLGHSTANSTDNSTIIALQHSHSQQNNSSEKVEAQ
jgi:penicillin-binding protein 2